MTMVTAVAAASSAAGQNSYLARFFQRDAEVITVTEAGWTLREPSRSKPVYYEMLVLGYADFGRSIAGLEPPEKTAMLKLIMAARCEPQAFPQVCGSCYQSRLVHKRTADGPHDRLDGRIRLSR